MWPVFLKFAEIRWLGDNPNLKITDFTVYKFESFEKIKNQKKYVKKLAEILRSQVRKIFQINNVCMVKIQILSNIQKWIHMPTTLCVAYSTTTVYKAIPVSLLPF
jgi:S-adenosylmethionine synthetase